MKIKLTLAIFLLIVISVKAQIYTPGGIIQGASTSNNIGIGATSPLGKLDIFTGLTGTTSLATLPTGTISFGNNNTTLTIPTIFSKSSNGVGMSLFTGTNDVNAFPDMRFTVMEENGTDFTTLTSSAFRFARFSTPLLEILRNGNVGIGTTAPNYKLQVAGDIALTSSAQKIYTSNIQTWSGNLNYDCGGNGNVHIFKGGDVGIGERIPAFGKLELNNTAFGTQTLSFYTADGTANSRVLLQHITASNSQRFNFTSSFSTGSGYANWTFSNGNVGIGVTNPINKLDVNGTIHSKEVKVDMEGWSDFVFKKEYELPTLEAVEKQINEKGHLKDIPTEEEVLKNGINLGEMNSKLLQKIEELTLYMIAQEKKNNDQYLEIEKSKNEIETLKKENESFRSIFDRLSRIEEKLK